VIRVFLIAASPLARAGLEELLRKRKVRTAGSAASLEAAQTLLEENPAEVVLLDASGEGVKRIVEELAESNWAGEVPLVLLAGELAPGDAPAALRAGVRAVLPSELLPEQLLAALEAVAAGLLVMHPADVPGALAETASRRPLAELVEPLTAREREVLQMLAAGSGNKQIAAKLAISEHTVKFHVASILGKLGAESRTEAVALGIRRGLVML
jgi:two-component system, NarL family, response regulator YdfI